MNKSKMTHKVVYGIIAIIFIIGLYLFGISDISTVSILSNISDSTSTVQVDSTLTDTLVTTTEIDSVK